MGCEGRAAEERACTCTGLNTRWPADDSVFKHCEYGSWAFVSLAIATVYGVIHVIGWTAQFPSAVERALWHAATLTLIVLGVAFFQYAALPTPDDPTTCTQQ